MGYRIFNFLIALAFLLAMAEPPLMERVPNTRKNECTTCHANGLDPDWDRLNVFGKAFRDNDSIWNPTLSFLDSDSDGYSNGVELGDSLGIWLPYQPDPGNRDSVTRPGDSWNFPGDSTPLTLPDSLDIFSTHDGFIAKWYLDKHAKCFLEYGLSASYGDTAFQRENISDPDAEISFHVLYYRTFETFFVQGLNSLTDYYYRLNCTDESGQTAVSGGASFKTKPSLVGYHLSIQRKVPLPLDSLIFIAPVTDTLITLYANGVLETNEIIDTLSVWNVTSATLLQNNYEVILDFFLSDSIRIRLIDIVDSHTLTVKGAALGANLSANLAIVIKDTAKTATTAPPIKFMPQPSLFLDSIQMGKTIIAIFSLKGTFIKQIKLSEWQSHESFNKDLLSNQLYYFRIMVGKNLVYSKLHLVN